ncbi:MAG: hypothetical protein V1831_00850 [Candidatus Woesearchaeota archaeon]
MEIKTESTIIIAKDTPELSLAISSYELENSYKSKTEELELND